MIELNNFYNDGTGWSCSTCERVLSIEEELESSRSLFYREGEAESKFPKMASRARAKWLDRIHETLICPRCGVTESVSKA